MQLISFNVDELSIMTHALIRALDASERRGRRASMLASIEREDAEVQKDIYMRIAGVLATAERKVITDVAITGDLVPPKPDSNAPPSPPPEPARLVQLSIRDMTALWFSLTAASSEAQRELDRAKAKPEEEADYLDYLAEKARDADRLCNKVKKALDRLRKTTVMHIAVG